MDPEGHPTAEGLIDYQAECQKKDAIIADLKKKLGEYAKKTMELINEKNQLKKLLDEQQEQTGNNGNPISQDIKSTSNPTSHLLTSSQTGELLGIGTASNEVLIDYKSEVEKRDKIIQEMNKNFQDYVKNAMNVINERNALKAELDAIKEKSQVLEDKEGKIESVWKRKLMEAERKVRAVEKILEQKNKDLSEFQSRYIAELTAKDRKIEELTLKITKLEQDLAGK